MALMTEPEPGGDKRSQSRMAYVAPSVTIVGSVSGLTLGMKSFNASDGASFFGVPEGFGS